MNRRELLVKSATLAPVAVLSSSLLAQAPKGADDKTHAVIKALQDTIAVGERCMTHCLTELSKGEKVMAECANSVRECLAVCDATVSLAAMDAKRFKAFAKLCAEVCKDCEKACRKHENHHAICKECADSCKRSIEALEAL